MPIEGYNGFKRDKRGRREKTTARIKENSLIHSPINCCVTVSGSKNMSTLFTQSITRKRTFVIHD